ncbi:MAG: hypothetical protein E4H05_03720, partial [Acidimicrobiales bacterium]
MSGCRGFPSTAARTTAWCSPSCSATTRNNSITSRHQACCRAASPTPDTIADVTLRFPVPPMKATMGSTTAVPDGADWAFEVKWDGYRTIVHIADGAARLQSAAGHDVTARWPEFAELADSVNASTAILDTELVVFDDDGRPRFELVQQSGAGSTREAVLQIFDVVQIDGVDVIDLPYEARRRLLEQLVEPGPNWTVPTPRIGGGAELLEATASQGLEGVIAKRVDSLYRPGTRSK